MNDLLAILSIVVIAVLSFFFGNMREKQKQIKRADDIIKKIETEMAEVKKENDEKDGRTLVDDFNQRRRSRPDN